jgi:hypothetical protein
MPRRIDFVGKFDSLWVLPDDCCFVMVLMSTCSPGFFAFVSWYSQTQSQDRAMLNSPRNKLYSIPEFIQNFSCNSPSSGHPADVKNGTRDEVLG